MFKWNLYRDYITLSEIAERMRERGVRIDRELVRRMDTLSERDKDALFPYTEKGNKRSYSLFNPQSPKDVVEYFGKNGIKLGGSSKGEIVKALEALSAEFYDDEPYLSLVTRTDLPPIHQQLINVGKYKGLGKGFSAWYDDHYFPDGGDFLHPRFITTGTSTGRWSGSFPNLMNVPRFPDIPKQHRGKSLDELIALRVVSAFVIARKCIIPRNDNEKILKWDKSQLELRTSLYQAGYNVKEIDRDAFITLVGRSNGAFKYAADLIQEDERFIAKSVSYGSLYGEGLMLYSDRDLRKPQIKKQIDSGAILFYPKWKYCGKYVGFTGVNLAERLFKSKDDDARAKANKIVDLFFTIFNDLREWQKEVFGRVERDGSIENMLGRFLRLMGSPKDNAKIALAFLGSGVGADHVQGTMIEYFQLGYVPMIQVHDELVFSVPKEWDRDQCIEFLSIGEREDKRIPGFVCPIKMYEGPNWLDMEQIKR